MISKVRGDGIPVNLPFRFNKTCHPLKPHLIVKTFFYSLYIFSQRLPITTACIIGALLSSFQSEMRMARVCATCIQYQFYHSQTQRYDYKACCTVKLCNSRTVIVFWQCLIHIEPSQCHITKIFNSLLSVWIAFTQCRTRGDSNLYELNRGYRKEVLITGLCGV